MGDSNSDRTVNRRDFMATTATAAAGSTLLGSKAVGAATTPNDGLDHRNERPDVMAYRKLGRTNFMCSRLVFGCGAALMGGKAVRLLERAFEAGVNHYDVGYDTYYRGSEKYLSEFLKAHRDEVWVTSKALPRSSSGIENELSPYTVETAKIDADLWTQELDKSLQNLKCEYVDAYYNMGVGVPDAVRSEEMNNAFLAAKKAGKVGHFGISTHRRAQACLEAAVETGWYSLAMIAITPSGWYDWFDKDTLAGTPKLTALRPVLDRARDAGIGLIGMKAGRLIAPGSAAGKGDTTAFDGEYSEGLLKSGLNPFQRSYAYVLENGLDVVNSDMQNFTHFEENLIAARDSGKYFSGTTTA